MVQVPSAAAEGGGGRPTRCQGSRREDDDICCSSSGTQAAAAAAAFRVKRPILLVPSASSKSDRAISPASSSKKKDETRTCGENDVVDIDGPEEVFETKEEAASFLSSVDVLLFDCDGVLWHGDKLLPGVEQMLHLLLPRVSSPTQQQDKDQQPQQKKQWEQDEENQDIVRRRRDTQRRDTHDTAHAKRAVPQQQRQQQKRVYLLTNNSTKSRKGFLKKLEAFGFVAQEEQVICSAAVAAAFLEERRQLQQQQLKQQTPPLSGSSASDAQTGAARGTGTAPQAAAAVGRETAATAGRGSAAASEQASCLPDPSVVYVVGEKGLQEELQIRGFTALGGPEDNDKKLDFASNRNLAVPFRRDVGSVVVGLDRDFNYYKLQYAQLCINENKAFFLATNRDALGNFTPTQKWAGAGAMVAAVEAATRQTPAVVGKPSRYLCSYLNQLLGATPRNRICLVGDRLDTDILLASLLGVRSVLTLTGVTTPELLQQQIRRQWGCSSEQQQQRQPEDAVQAAAIRQQQQQQRANSSSSSPNKRQKQQQQQQHEEAKPAVAAAVARTRALCTAPSNPPVGEGAAAHPLITAADEAAEAIHTLDEQAKNNKRQTLGDAASFEYRHPSLLVPDYLIQTAAHLIL